MEGVKEKERKKQKEKGKIRHIFSVMNVNPSRLESLMNS